MGSRNRNVLSASFPPCVTIHHILRLHEKLQTLVLCHLAATAYPQGYLELHSRFLPFLDTMKDLIYVLLTRGVLLLIGRLILLIHFTCRCVIQKSVPGQPMMISSYWKEFLATLSILLALCNVGSIVALADRFRTLEPFMNQDCHVIYNPVNCTSAIPGWHYTCLWFTIPSLVGFAMISTSITRSKQLLGVPGLLFHPRNLAFALFLFLIITLACTPLATPSVFFKGVSFRTWENVSLSLAILAINSYIFGVVVMVNGVILLVLQFRMKWVASRPTVTPGVISQQGRRRHRRSQPEWIPLESRT